MNLTRPSSLMPATPRSFILRSLTALCALYILCGAILLLVGCSTTTGGDRPRVDPVEMVIRAGMTAAIINNPQYAPMIDDVVSQIDIMLARGHTTPALVTSFLAELAAKHALSTADIDRLRELIAQFRAVYYTATGEDFPLEFPIAGRAAEFVERVKGQLLAAKALASIVQPAPQP